MNPAIPARRGPISRCQEARPARGAAPRLRSRIDSRGAARLALLALLGTACATSQPFNPADLATPGADGGGGGGEGDGGDVTSGPLSITPPLLTIVTTGDLQRQPFTVTSATHGDVTARATYSLDDSGLGAVVSGAVVVPANSARGGRTVLTARFGGQTATAQVLVRLVAADTLDNNAPQNPSLFFGNDETGAKPAWVYPLTGAVVPRNIGAPLLQFSTPLSSLYTRVRIDCPTYTQDIYNGARICNMGTCRYTLRALDYSALIASCAGEEVTFKLTASPGQNKPVGSDGPISMRLTRESLRAAIYYGTRSGTENGLIRTTLDAKQRQLYRPANRDGFSCVGCHSVSADGQRVAFSTGYQQQGGVLDGRNGLRYVLKPGLYGNWNFPSFSPMGDKVLVTQGGTVSVRKTNDGTPLGGIPSDIFQQIGGIIAMPDWSPDGKNFVFARGPGFGAEPDENRSNIGDLMIMPYDNGSFGVPPTQLLGMAPGVFHLYPAYTYDGQYILYNTAQAPCGNGVPAPGCRSYSARNTFLRMIKSQPVAQPQPIDLHAAWQRASVGSNCPRGAPGLVDGRYLFIAFHSHLPYGFESDGTNVQIYMAAVDMDKVKKGAGEDPSAAPAWLPGQDAKAENFMPTWTATAACEVDADCPSGLRCQNNACVAPVN